MTTKRAHGEGSIYRRADGKWCGSIRHEAGRAVFYGRTKAEVRDKLRTAVARMHEGAPVRDSKRTIEAWLSDWETNALPASSLKSTTQDLYKSIAKTHLKPAPFGAIALDKLRPSDVDALIVRLRGKELTDATVQRIYRVLRVSLKAAVRDDLLAKNPSARVTMPKAERTEARYLTAAEVASLLRAAEGTRYHAALSLIAATGLRSGEARALRWADVDFDEKAVKVRGTLSRVDGALVVTEPKTAKSRRTLPLSPAVAALLKLQRRNQRRERIHAGNQWTDTGHVFTTESGQAVDSANLRRALKVAAESAGLSDVCVHTLRHSAATAWLEAGVNLKAVSELLGHADIRVTADCYGHVTEATSRAAMDTLSDALGI